MKKHYLLLLLLFYLTYFNNTYAQIDTLSNLNFPRLMIKKGEGNTQYPMELCKLNISVLIAGNIATTTMDMTFRNNLPRVLEGELVFPLDEGQTVSLFSMDVNGKLNEGVVVKKQKGQQVFETIVRRGVDPGLLEWTKGNNFRSRIYPINGNGTKRIIIGYEHELPLKENGYLYKLPFGFNDSIENFNIDISILGEKNTPEVSGKAWDFLQFFAKQNNMTSSFSEEKILLKENLELLIPQKQNEQKLIIGKGVVDSSDYFYINMLPPQLEREKKQPSKLCVIWDVSASAQSRNTQKEIQLLTSYLQSIKEVQLQLITFSNAVHDDLNFKIEEGNHSTFVGYLESINYDGGTQLGAIDMESIEADEIILVTDGVSNFGKAEITLSKTPVIVINSSKTAEHSYQNYIAQKTAGIYLNLQEIGIKDALGFLTKQKMHFISVTTTEGNVTDIYPNSPTYYQNNFTIAGKLHTAQSKVCVNFGFGNEITHKEVLTLNAATRTEKAIERIWVQKKIATLNMHYQNQEEAITELGVKYGIVTRNTSLIILETLQDYIRFEIVPPKEMQKEYFAGIKLKTKEAKKEKDYYINKALQSYIQKICYLSDTLDYNSIKHRYIVNRMHRNTPRQNICFVNNDSIDVPETPVDEAEIEENNNNIAANDNIEAPEVPLRRVSGQLIDSETGDPIPFGNIVVLGLNTGTASDFDGNFNVMAPENATLNATHVGYTPAAVDIGSSTNIQIPLQESTEQLNTVQIVSNKAPLINKDQTQSGGVVTAEEIIRIPRIYPVTDPSTVGGVYYDECTGKMHIRGSRSSANVIFIDGVKVIGSISVPKSAIDKVRVITGSGSVRHGDFIGGFPARYGDFTGGIIEITTKNSSYVGRRSSYVYSPMPKLTEWGKKFRRAGSAKLSQVYREQKKKFKNNTGFYLDAADHFIEHDKKEEALRILSNIVEAELKNHEMMRVVARRLQQLGETETAIPIFKSILKLRPEEPQSYRDLALAYESIGKYQEAVDMLIKVITKKWDSRHYKIKTIVLTEINSIIARFKDSIDIGNIDERLIVNLPVDTRIVLNWDADNTDMDLWVSGPKGEKYFYGKIRGYLSRNSGGYGPEEFVVKDIPKGKYKITVKYEGTRRQNTKGPVTVQLQIFTNYGSKKQKLQEVTARLTKRNQVIDIATLIVRKSKSQNKCSNISQATNYR